MQFTQQSRLGAWWSAPFAAALLLGCGPGDDPTGKPQDSDDTVAPTGSPTTAPAGLLSDILVEGDSYWPAWSASISAYGLHEGAAAGGLVIAPVPTSDAVTVSLRHETLAGVVLAEGSGELTVSPAAGERVVVVAEDGTSSGTWTFVVVPDDMPAITIERIGTPSPGYTFLTDSRQGAGARYLVIIDEWGIPVWYDGQAGASYDFRAQPSGALTYIGQPPSGGANVGHLLDAVSWAVTSTLPPAPTPTGTPSMDEHELRETAEGTYVLLGEAVGPADLTALGGQPEAPVVHLHVQELTAAGDLVFDWRTDQAMEPADSPVLVFDTALTGWDYAHANSAEVDPDDGNLIVSIRLRNEVLKIARAETMIDGQTFLPGEVIWRLGGEDSDFTFVGDDRADGWVGFGGQHCAVSLPGGRLLLYDNAMAREATGPSLQDQQIVMTATGQSRYVEYQLDTSAMTATLVGSYELEGSGLTGAGGSVQRLPDGHTLIGWGDLPMTTDAPTFTEVDESGQVVTHGYFDGAWSYRAYRFEATPPGTTR